MGKFKVLRNIPITPIASMNAQEIKIMIQEAEKGAFYTMQEVDQKINKWKTKYSN